MKKLFLPCAVSLLVGMATMILSGSQNGGANIAVRDRFIEHGVHREEWGDPRTHFEGLRHWDEVVIATKVHGKMHDGPNGLEKQTTFNSNVRLAGVWEWRHAHRLL